MIGNEVYYGQPSTDLERRPKNLQRRFFRRQDRHSGFTSLEIKNLIQIFGIALYVMRDVSGQMSNALDKLTLTSQRLFGSSVSRKVSGLAIHGIDRLPQGVVQFLGHSIACRFADHSQHHFRTLGLGIALGL